MCIRDSRGIVAGRYKLIKNIETPSLSIIKELKKPHLIKQDSKIYPAIDASEDVAQDIKRLLRIGLISEKNNKEERWEEVLPIYPNSPVKD